MDGGSMGEPPQPYPLIEEGLLKRNIVHLLRNYALSHSSFVAALLDALAVGELTAGREVQDLMHAMRRSSEQMRRFLNALIDVAEADDQRPAALFDIVRQAADLFEVSLFKRKIHLEIAVGREIVPNVPFSVAILALANLIDNAKDAMPGGDKIRIEAEPLGEMILCRVIDQGCGVPDHMRETIFDKGVTTKQEGRERAGQGLALTRTLLQKHRSAIRLTASSSKGSTFTLYFPG